MDHDAAVSTMTTSGAPKDGVKAAAALPTGTVTFLFSDIEGSTQRWESHRPAMQEALRHHDGLMNAAIAANGGHVFKTMGDAFCSAFSAVPDAIAAALMAQRSLRAHDFSAVDGLNVRMAIHVGLADERNGDYFGPSVNRVARLLAIGHGGQVLLSGAAADLAQGEMPAQTTLRDLGAHRLKDLTHPEQVYQLNAPDMPQSFLPLRSLEALPNNLPLQLTSFLGRDEEVAHLRERLKTVRLLTLVGTGGVGKSRLSLQVAADLLDHFEDGVWFVELAPIADPALVPNAIASVFEIVESEKRPLLETIVQSLKDRHMLVIVDNCEHVVGSAAKAIDALLRGCPRLKVIASSREGLGIAGESVQRVSSLGVPAVGQPITAEAALHYGAIALFVERAAAASERFKLTDTSAPIVATICRRLDGIPLAIELAAPRVKALSVEEIASRLDERFRILTGGSRTALPRQQTMRALIDWSHDLLSDGEQAVFRRLAVFAGGWTLDAANAVCSDEAIEVWDVLDLLSALVDKSLVVAELTETEQRYRLLESTRQYAFERLQKSGELERVQRRHAEHFLAVAESAERNWSTTALKVWLEPLQTEWDNFRAAIDWALGADAQLAIALVGALRNFWREAGAIVEGLRYVQAARALVDGRTPKDKDAALWLTAAFINSALVNNQEALDAAKEGLVLYEALGDRLASGMAMELSANALGRMRRHAEAEPLFDRALAIFREHNDRRWISISHTNRARSLIFTGQYELGRNLLIEALNGARAVGDERQTRVILNNLAEAEFALGNAENAAKYGLENLAAIRKSGLFGRFTLPNQLVNMAGYFIELGRLDEARIMARDALDANREGQWPSQNVIAVQHLAVIAALQGEHAAGAKLLGYTDAAFAALHAWREPTEQKNYDRALSVLRERMSPEQLKAAFAEGATWSDERAVEEALRL